MGQLSQEKQKLIILILTGLLYSLGLAYFFQTLPSARLTSDLFPRWHASRMLLTAGRSIYDGANAVEISAITGWPHLNQLGYYYPAYLLIFTAPLSLLPYEAAYILWAALGLWFIWLSMGLLADLLRPQLSLNRLTLLLVLVTISVPVFQHTLYAQFNALGVLALTLTYRALYRQKYFVAGLWAGGLLFKPHATLIPLTVLLIWTMFASDRRRFWLGLTTISILFWGVAEWLESNWLVSFLQSLGNYVPISAIIDKIWNPYQIGTLTLLGLTLWLVYYLRHVLPDSLEFSGLLAWALNLNALLAPMFGMMHMVSMGLVLVILINGFMKRYPALSSWLWAGLMALLIAGLLSFIIPLILVGPTGLQITITEIVYRFSMPLIFSLLSLPLIFARRGWLATTSNRG